jgi:hypothetical protein
LEKFGYQILKDEEGRIMIGVDSSSYLLEGVYGFHRIEPIDSSKIILIDKTEIKDYNSLWEITKSGWDSETELVYPYINLNGVWFRWDNQSIRKDGGFYEWDSYNIQKYMGVILGSKN